MPTFETPTAITVDIDVTGDVRITASDRADAVVVVQPRDPSKTSDVKAAQQTRVIFIDRHLVVRSPKNWRRYTPFGGGESVELQIELPTGSDVTAESALGDIHTEGELGSCRLRTAMGNIRLDHTAALHAKTGFGRVAVDHVTGTAEVTTGSGAIRIEGIDGSAVIKNSNGDTEVGDVTGDLRVKAANGAISIARAHASVSAKTACGDVRIAEVSRGEIVMETSAGELEVGIREGVAAWLDVRSQFGTVRNLLGAADGPGAADGTVEVRARTSYGDVLIGRAPNGGRAAS